MIIDLNKQACDYSLSKADCVESFVKNLRGSFGITTFGFLRIYSNSRYFYLANDKNLIKDYFNKVTETNIWLEKVLSPSKEFNMLLWPRNPENSSMELYRDNNCWNGVSLMNYNEEEEYIDLWWFASDLGNERILDFYLNQGEFLSTFVKYFSKKYEDIFNYKQLGCYQNGFDFDNLSLSQSKQAEIETKQKFLKEFFPNGFEAKGRNGFITFTNRELDCLKLISSGKSMKEMGRDLSISWRTVEKYMQAIQVKSGYNLKSDLISLYKEQIKGFLEF